MSTTTSTSAPDGQVTYFAWLGGTSAKCTPRTVPAADTEQFACTSVNGWPVTSLNRSARNHSRNAPRESPMILGVISNAPAMVSSRIST